MDHQRGKEKHRPRYQELEFDYKTCCRVTGDDRTLKATTKHSQLKLEFQIKVFSATTLYIYPINIEA